MDAAGLMIGALLCWRAPMPDLVARRELPVRVLELQTLPTGDAGAWVETLEGRLASLRWHVAQTDLRHCPEPHLAAKP